MTPIGLGPGAAKYPVRCCDVRVTNGRRHQPLDGLADQLARRPAEHRFEGAIRRHDRRLRIHRDNALRGGLQQQLQFPIALLVTARLERLLGPPALGDVEIEPGEPRDLAVGSAVGASQTLYPRHVPVGQHDAKRVVPRILPVVRRISSRRPSTCGRSSSCTRDIHASKRRRFFGGEAVSRTKAIIPIDVIGAGVPRPGASCRRIERQTQPLFTLPQRSLGAGALDRVPGPFGDVADQRDLHRRPRAWCRVVGAEGGHQLPAFQQHHSDKRRDLSRLHGDPLRFREPRIRINVVHHHRLAAPVRIAQRRPKAPHRPLSGKRCDTACVFTPNDVLAVFDFRVADTVHAQVFPQQPRGDFLHVERIAQRPQRIGEPEEECLSLFAPQQEFAQELHLRFAGLALGDICRDAREAHGAPAVRGTLEKRLARARDPPHLARIRTTDPELFCKRARSTRIESRRHGAFDASPIVRMAEVQALGQRRESSLGNSQERADFGRPECLIRRSRHSRARRHQRSLWQA